MRHADTKSVPKGSRTFLTMKPAAIAMKATIKTRNFAEVKKCTDAPANLLAFSSSSCMHWTRQISESVPVLVCSVRVGRERDSASKYLLIEEFEWRHVTMMVLSMRFSAISVYENRKQEFDADSCDNRIITSCNFRNSGRNDHRSQSPYTPNLCSVTLRCIVHK